MILPPAPFVPWLAEPRDEPEPDPLTVRLEWIVGGIGIGLAVAIALAAVLIKEVL